MTIVRRPSPFGELMSLRQAMDRLFEDSFVRSPAASVWSGATGALPLDVRTTSDALIVEAALPGVSPDDVEITVEGGTLAISGSYREERSEDEGDYLVREIRRGSFGRTITLPDGLEADRATATFENGMLALRIPKAEQVKPRQIRISASGEPPAEVEAAVSGESPVAAAVGTDGRG